MSFAAASLRRSSSLLSCPRTWIRPSQYRTFTSCPVCSAFTNSNSVRAAPSSSSPAAKPASSSFTRTAQSTTKPASASPSSSSPNTSLSNRTVRPTIPATEPPPPTARSTALESDSQSQRSLTDGLLDAPPEVSAETPAIDWTRSYHGLGSVSFTPEQTEILLGPIEQDDVEVKPDGIVYLPEIKYRRILNKAFGPGGWGLAPRGESIVTAKLVTREYGLIVQGRLVSIARGEQQYFDPDGIPTATEGCKSNALMRCCKDLGIASELWDPRFIRKFTAEMTKEVWVEHVLTKKKKKIVLRKDDVVRYPFKESRM
ncbi:Mgm101p-domain-containing protein [Westerdykella ornata]|uniref:Mitochondrial genome maintenance protein MGM101 n=1 Tax=Westerdykella ornata TaxID=318751 RepID=A0A6A6JVM4_WESOR|nr:Mgm101p-domain-containing protein [Westerdykella ornata]KAF2280274.1 Mgm101p-domain-containing protein [Westerdykella ornata]